MLKKFFTRSIYTHPAGKSKTSLFFNLGRITQSHTVSFHLLQLCQFPMELKAG